LQAPYSLAINQQVLVPVNGIQQANVQQVTPAATPTQKPQQQIPAKPTTSPVVQAAKPAKATLHAVQAGDTVYSLGRKYNMKPADIITMNNLQAPYALAIGQQVKLNPNAKAITAVASNTTITATPAKTANKNFQIGMPAQGPISVKYGKQPDGTTSSGIRIAVKDGASVQTVEDGQVIYVGNIKGYGQMVLVRHEDGWITNYARLKQTLVSQGDRVYKGKAIAIAGQTLDFNKSELFFEVRKGTATQDPLAHFVNS
jgi:murein DD-endopeptidase MepM/ murein hydrolase activator NlpD